MATIASRVQQATRADAITGRYDAWLLIGGLAMLAFGTVMVASASFPEAVSNGKSPFYFLEHHVVFLVGGMVLAWALMRTELKDIESWSKLLPLVCIALLLVVAVPGLGVTVKGARRWINLGITRFQPVEVV